MFVLRMSDDGVRLRFASIHMHVVCGGRAVEFGRTLSISRHTPTADQLYNDDYLKAGRVRTESLLARLYFSDGEDDGDLRLRGTLRLEQIRERSLRALWTIRSTWTPYIGRSRSCVVRRSFAMKRSPGEIFVGSTSHDEPVTLVRDPGGAAVSISIGYYAECGVDDNPWGLYLSLVGLEPDNSFAAGDTDSVILPRWTADYRMQGRFVNSRRATGRLG